MQIDQFLRRLTWRLRRRFRRAADNDPIVSVEHPAPSVAKPPPPRIGRLARTAAAFLATLVVLGVAYGVMAAVNSRTRPTIGEVSHPDAVAPVRP